MLQIENTIISDDIIEKKSITHNICITSRLTGKLGNWITNILYDIRNTRDDIREKEGCKDYGVKQKK